MLAAVAAATVRVTIVSHTKKTAFVSLFVVAGKNKMKESLGRLKSSLMRERDQCADGSDAPDTAGNKTLEPHSIF